MNKTTWLCEPPASSRRERRKQEFREKILFSAIELFEKQGCEATTLEEICDSADVSRPTFYSYYASKGELIQALGEKLWLNMATELIESMDSLATTRQYLQAFFDMARKELKQYGLMERDLIRQAMFVGPEEEGSANLLKALVAMFIDVYDKGRQKGEVSTRYSLDFLAEMTMGGIISVMMNWALDENYPVDQRLQELSDYLPAMLELA